MEAFGYERGSFQWKHMWARKHIPGVRGTWGVTKRSALSKGSWSSVLWELKQETCMSESHAFSSCYHTSLPFGSASHTPTNPWSLCEAHRGGSSNPCARRSLRSCLKTNQNPSDTDVNCHFSHKFGITFWYGGLLRIVTEQSTYLLWYSCHCLSLSSLVCCCHLSVLQHGPAPLTHLICCFQNISLHEKYQ